MDVQQLSDHFTKAGLKLSSFTEPAMYDISAFLPKGFNIPDTLTDIQKMHLAEKLRGHLKTHVGYAYGADNQAKVNPTNPHLIPHFTGGDPRKVAAYVQKNKQITITLNGHKNTILLSAQDARLIGFIDGKRPVSEITKHSGMDVFSFNISWLKLSNKLMDFGILLFSDLYV